MDTNGKKQTERIRGLLRESGCAANIETRCLRVITHNVDGWADLEDASFVDALDPAKLKHVPNCGKKALAALLTLREYLDRQRWVMPDPTYQDAENRVFEGDCFDLMTRLRVNGEMFDLILTDPPYNISREKGDFQYRGEKSAVKRDFGGWDFGFDPQALMEAAHPLLRPGGSLIAFTSDLLIGAYKLQEPKLWTKRGTMIWQKANPPTSPRPGYVSACEFIVWMAKPGAKATWEADGYTLNIFHYPIAAGRKRFGHPTEKPIQLLKDLLMRHSDHGDRVLDPFCGSGSTLRAAKDLGRMATGIEMDPEYVAMACQRMSQESFGFDAKPIQLSIAGEG